MDFYINDKTICSYRLCSRINVRKETFHSKVQPSEVDKQKLVPLKTAKERLRQIYYL